ncbi:MAG: autotransporter outer membrane beta-barrel domain-containing protein [Desulfobulbus sp.]|nr:autotransporter outer membrane beta-barrel domain-containing protein [Desulfobulbus sp.]
MSLLNQSGDLIAGWGTNAAIRTAIQAERDSARLGAFVSMSGGWSRYDTGCHADLSSISLMVGVSRRVELELGNLAFGAFFEYGNGSYDTYAAVHGDGDLYHLGGGLIGHMDFTKTGSGHFYTEASVRAGGVENDYRHSGLYDSWGREATYDASSAYYGIHLGVGYLWRMTDKAGLDLYGKYFWTRQEGDAVRLSAGEPVDFDSLNSHRLSMGTRFNYAVLEQFSPYVGVAYDHGAWPTTMSLRAIHPLRSGAIKWASLT